MPITQERAERIARAHACAGCLEYSYRRVKLAAARPALRDALGVEWEAVLVCGVCGREQALGIDGDGDIVFVG
jgi:hypothetical protein